MPLTNDDFKNLKDLLEITIDEKLEEKLNEKLKYLPTKEDFYASEDRVTKEIRDAREEMIVLSGMKAQINNHETRIEKIEKKISIQATA